MQLSGYCVAILLDDGSIESYFDGKEFQPDANKMRIFGPGEIEAARREQGNQQRFTREEVKVIPLNFDASHLTISIPTQTQPLPPVVGAK